MEHQAKLNEITHPFYIVFQVLKVHLIIFFVIQSPDLLVLIALHESAKLRALRAKNVFTC